ncbi:hypothetical protein [Nocardiopsis sp. NPDC006832]|uniref:hypothetical protein n=1 Tax=Nocardiopsis sp. NPDC006832 TaxID=3157188 RepID=UPI0034033C64
MSNATIPMDLRRVLDAPRGRRFSHTPHRPGTRPSPRPSSGATADPLPPLVSLGRTPRERELLAQMPDTPGLRRRIERGDLPERIRRAASEGSCWRQDQRPDHTAQPEPEPNPAPKPAHEPDEDVEFDRPLPIPRPRREYVPPPPLPRRSDRPRRPTSHRRPRRRIGHLITGYALAALAGALAQPLITFLS